MFVGDVGHAEDAPQIQQNVVRINGQRSVYIPVLKQGGANTIAVVDGIEAAAAEDHRHADGNEAQGDLRPVALTSATAIARLEHEAVSGAVLASLMILIFLGSFRSTFAIFLSIPLSILAGAFGLYDERIDHQHHDAGRLRARDRPTGR